MLLLFSEFLIYLLSALLLILLPFKCWQSDCYSLHNRFFLCMIRFLKFWKNLKGSRICHLKICYFGILIILSWRQLRWNRYKKSSLPSSYLPKSRTLNCKGASSPPLCQERLKLIPRDNSRPLWAQRLLYTREIYITHLAKLALIYHHVVPLCIYLSTICCPRNSKFFSLILLLL